MENTQMDYFLEVCRCGSITRAGKQLKVTPQAVSKAIAALERQLGFPLLIRRPEGCVPTEKGLEVRRLGLRMRRFNDQLLQQMQALAEPPAQEQEVRIGVWGAFASIMPPADYIDFHELYPHIRLWFRGYPSPEDCERALTDGSVDLAFCPAHGINDSLVCLQEYGSTVCLTVNSRNPLAGSREIPLAALREQKLIADELPDGTISFAGELAAAGVTPVLTLPPLSDPLKRQLVLQGDYVAFSYCPPGWLPYGIIPVRVTELHRFEYSLFSRAAGRELSEAAQLYADYIVPRFKKDIFV